MGADPDDADLPDESGIFDDLLTPEFTAEMQRVMDQMQARLGRSPGEDEQGNPLPRLDLEDPPTTPLEDPLLRVGYALLAQLPEYWESAMLHVTAAADEIRTFATVVVHEDDPRESRIKFFSDLAEPCSALREETYEPEGRGVWYNATIWLYSDGTIKPTYDYNTPPFGYWGPREVELVRRDQELYPRDPENLPPWHPAR